MTLPREIIIKGHRIRKVWIGALLVALYYSVLFLNLPGGLPTLPPAVEEPIRTLQAKVHSNPDDSLAVFRLGEAYKLKGNIAVARPLLERALRLAPSLDHARFMLAEIHRDDGKLWTAYREFSQVYSRHPNDMGPALKAAECCRERGDSGRAETLYREIIGKKQDVALAHYWLGVLLSDRNANVLAIRSFETALRLDPALTDARVKLTALRSSPPDVNLHLMREHWWKIELPLVLSCLIGIILWSARGVPGIPVLRSKEVYLHVYLVCLATLLFVHFMKITRDPALNGEELAVAYKNILYFENRIQCDYMATNFSSTFFYWLGSHLVPVTVQSQRIFKIAVVALLPCLGVMLLRRNRPNASLFSQMFCAALFVLIPSVSWLSTMATEYCVDSVFSIFMLWVALGLPERGWRVIDWVRVVMVGVIAIWVAHFYGSSLVLLPVTALVVIVRGFESASVKRGAVCLRMTCLVLVGLAVGVAILWPFLYFSGHDVSMFAGGGKVSLSLRLFMQNLTVVLRDLFVRSESYLVGGDVMVAAFPIFGFGVLVVGLALVGGAHVTRVKRDEGLCLIAVIIMSLVVAGLASSCPGIRRVVPAIVCFVVLAAIGLDRLLELRVNAHGEWQTWIRQGAKAVGIIVIVLSLWSWMQTFVSVHMHYQAWLQRNFTLLPGKNYEESVEILVQEIQKNKITLSSKDYHRDVVLLLYFICCRRGVGYVPPYYDGVFDSRLPQREIIDQNTFTGGAH